MFVFAIRQFFVSSVKKILRILFRAQWQMFADVNAVDTISRTKGVCSTAPRSDLTICEIFPAPVAECETNKTEQACTAMARSVGGAYYHPARGETCRTPSHRSVHRVRRGKITRQCLGNLDCACLLPLRFLMINSCHLAKDSLKYASFRHKQSKRWHKFF